MIHHCPVRPCLSAATRVCEHINRCQAAAMLRHAEHGPATWNSVDGTGRNSHVEKLIAAGLLVQAGDPLTCRLGHAGASWLKREDLLLAGIALPAAQKPVRRRRA